MWVFQGAAEVHVHFFIDGSVGLCWLDLGWSGGLLLGGDDGVGELLHTQHPDLPVHLSIRCPSLSAMLLLVLLLVALVHFVLDVDVGKGGVVREFFGFGVGRGRGLVFRFSGITIIGLV